MTMVLVNFTSVIIVESERVVISDTFFVTERPTQLKGKALSLVGLDITMGTLLLSTVLLFCSLQVLGTCAQSIPGPTSTATAGSPSTCNSSKEQACQVFQTCGVSCDSQPSKPSLYQACGMSCSSPFVADRRNRQKQVCYCDLFCTDFGDCCHDYKASATKFTSINIYTQCLTLDYTIYPFRSTVISRCPDDFTNGDVTSKCHSRGKDDVFQIVPVNGFLRDGRYYSFRNIYCAVCHRADVSQILRKGAFWKTGIAFKPDYEWMTQEEKTIILNYLVQNHTGTARVRSIYKSGYIQLFVIAPSLTHHCNVRVEPNSTECTNRCPSNATECSSYMYFSDYFPDTNNSDKLQFARCPVGGWPRLFCFDPRSVPTAKAYSFSHLMDFTGLSDEFSPKISGSSLKCSEDRIYDQQAQKCRPSVCPPKEYRMIDGSCGQGAMNITSLNNASLNNTITANDSFYFKCPLITYTDGEYEVKDGIVYVNSGLSFQPGDYFIQGNSVYVCNTFTNGTALRFFKYNKIQYKLTIAGNVISLCGLTIFVLTYALFKELRTLPGQIMMNLATTLFMAQLIILTAIDRTELPVLCKAVAIVEHFLWMCAFFWMNSMCFCIFRTFHKFMEKRQASPHAIYKYTLYSLLSPLVIIATCVTLDFATDIPFQYADEERCWISGYESITYGFAMPLAIITFLNIIFIVMTVIQFIRIKRQVRKHDKNNGENNRVLVITVKLFTVMASTWVFGYLGALTESIVLWYLFIIFNSLQGFVIFLAHICRKTIFLKYRELFSRKKSSDRASSFADRQREFSKTGCNDYTDGTEINDSETTM